MEFRFRRKYTGFFFIALILHIAILCFWLLTPNNIFSDKGNKILITLLAIANCEVLLAFYLGLFRKKYYAFYDKLIIKRSFLKNKIIDYKSITKIKENEKDSIVLGFGTRPSFKLYYTNRLGKETSTVVRADNNNLLLKVIKNEIQISNLNNTNSKKLTK